MLMPQAETVQQAPWWFAGIVGAVGVLAGIAAKAGFDLWAESRTNRREDELRFIGDKRQVYTDFLAACHNVADVEHEGRLLDRRIRLLDEDNSGGPAAIDEFNDDHERHKLRRADAYNRVNATAAAVDLVGTVEVVEAAAELLSKAHHPHLLRDRVSAESAFVDAARAELGYAPIGHLPGTPFEDFIGWRTQEAAWTRSE